MTTSSQTFDIRITSPTSDFHEFAQRQHSAFANNHLHSIIYPGPASCSTTTTATASRHSKALSSASSVPSVQVFFIEAVDKASGAIAGGAQWFFYDADAQRPEHVLVDWYPDADQESERLYAQRIMDQVNGRRFERMKGSHASLDLLFVDDEFQRKGVGAALIKWGCDEADKRGQKAFVDASPTGRPLYERMGFSVDEAVDLTEPGKEQALYYFMVRPPGATPA